MIDLDGFRLNVGIIIANHEKKLFWGKRINQQAWQFPQGGIKKDETPEAAMYRELYEEVGLQTSDVKIIGETKNWLTYKLPANLIRRNKKPICIGQRQKWFLLLLSAPDSAIKLHEVEHPEFDSWCWVNYWHPLKNVISFKKQVYKQVLDEFRTNVDLLFSNKIDNM